MSYKIKGLRPEDETNRDVFTIDNYIELMSKLFKFLDVSKSDNL
jgi:hypothetical protein